MDASPPLSGLVPDRSSGAVSNKLSGTAPPSQEKLRRIFSGSPAPTLRKFLTDHAKFSESILNLIRFAKTCSKPILLILATGLMLGGVFISGASFGFATPVGFSVFGAGFVMLTVCVTSIIQKSWFSAPKTAGDSRSDQPAFSAPNLSPEDFLFDDDWTKTNLTRTSQSFIDWQLREASEIFNDPEDFNIIECSYTFGDPEFITTYSGAPDEDPEVD